MIRLFVMYTCHGKLFLMASKPPIILKLPSIGVTCGTPHELKVLAVVNWVVNVGTAVEVVVEAVTNAEVVIGTPFVDDEAIVVNEVVVGGLVWLDAFVVVDDNVGNKVDIKLEVVPVNAIV